MTAVDLAAERGPLNFIGDVYDSALEPSRWNAVLRETARLVRGCAAAIIAHVPGEDALRLQAHWNIETHVGRITIAAPLADPDMPMLASLGMRAGSPGEDIAIVPLTKTVQASSLLMILRPAGTGAYSQMEAETIATLSPHLQQAAVIAALLDFTPLERHCAIGCFNPMHVGIILTDTTRKILHVNAAAEDMLDGCTLLCLEDELAARDSRSNAMLQDAIARAGKTRGIDARHRVTSIVVKGPGAKSLTLWVMRVEEGIVLPVGTLRSARIAVFVHASEMIDISAPESLLDCNPVRSAESGLLTLLSHHPALGHSRPASLAGGEAI
ncbi:PAS domain-containing protein [Hyphomicrobium sp.]|uniref:PAS domain-containing protein n=1 Tax=Hyphomicrobium sp. TaxID=82 RepID=UPI003565828D